MGVIIIVMIFIGFAVVIHGLLNNDPTRLLNGTGDGGTGDVLPYDVTNETEDNSLESSLDAEQKWRSLDAADSGSTALEGSLVDEDLFDARRVFDVDDIQRHESMFDEGLFDARHVFDVDDIQRHESMFDDGPLINPASGCAMVSGTMVDVCGNPYGSDLTSTETFDTHGSEDIAGGAFDSSHATGAFDSGYDPFDSSYGGCGWDDTSCSVGGWDD